MSRPWQCTASGTSTTRFEAQVVIACITKAVQDQLVAGSDLVEQEETVTIGGEVDRIYRGAPDRVVIEERASPCLLLLSCAFSIAHVHSIPDRPLLIVEKRNMPDLVVWSGTAVSPLIYPHYSQESVDREVEEDGNRLPPRGIPTHDLRRAGAGGPDYSRARRCTVDGRDDPNGALS